MPGRLAGKVALITGAGSGIGRATAELFASEGAAVAVLDIREEAAKEVVADLEVGGHRALAVGADVASDPDVRAAVARTVETFERLDVLYNNAGVDSSGSVADASEADWDRCFDVNVKGTFLASRAAVPHLAADGGGVIVNQSSVAGLVAVPDFAAYCAAKGAVIALTRSMAIDLAPRDIRVNVICPGTVYTPLMEPLMRRRGDGDPKLGLERTVAKYPIGRLGAPEDIARAALFLAGRDSAFATGAVFTIDGGMTAQ